MMNGIRTIRKSVNKFATRLILNIIMEKLSPCNIIKFMATATELIERLKEKKLKLVTAESCTGGLIAATLTAIPGSSEVYDCGFIVYSNEAKIDLLGVPKELIKKHGAVSREVAESIARGACRKENTSISVAATGVAGPASSEHKPVGLVYIAVCYQGKVRVNENHLSGSRTEIQAETVSRAFDLILSVI